MPIRNLSKIKDELPFSRKSGLSHQHQYPTICCACVLCFKRRKNLILCIANRSFPSSEHAVNLSTSATQSVTVSSRSFLAFRALKMNISCFAVSQFWSCCWHWCCCSCCGHHWAIIERLHCARTFLSVPIPVLFVSNSQLFPVIDNFQKAFRDRLQSVEFKILGRWRNNFCYL